MRRLLIGLALTALTVSNSGCFLPIYSGDPTRRTRQLINSSEDMRAALDEWERIWFLDQPSHLTPIRTHGGVL
jgi:hypothetical protein